MFSKSISLISAFLVSALWAETSLSVNLGDSIRPVTHVATGSLYGLTETYPTDIEKEVAPLKPNVFLAPARSGNGRQQPIGGAFLVSPRIKNTTGKVQIRLADILPGWPYAFKTMDAWLSEVTSVINDKKAAAVQNFDGYEIWNEPDGTWKNTSIDFNSELWKKTYELIRKLDPTAKIIGPSYSWYNGTRMEEFVKYCAQNNCMPDVISWHQWGSEGLVGAIEHYRNLEKKYNVSARAISINEYSSGTHTLEGCPGVSVPFIAKFERHGVESAMISWWFTNLPGRLGSLLTAQNERGGGWWLYKWYGDMEGYMAKVTPPNDKSDGVDGFAAVNKNEKSASLVVGGNTLGEVSVKIDGIPESFGNRVQVTREFVTWVDKDSAVAGTTLQDEKIYEVKNGSITVPVKIENVYYAYHLGIQAVIEEATFGEVAKIPGKIEAENYNVGMPNEAFLDKDSKNQGGAYREDAVDIVAIDDSKCGKKNCAGFALGYTEAGEWLRYSVEVLENSDYEIFANVATASETSSFEIFIDDSLAIDTVKVPKTDSSWNVYQEMKVGEVNLSKGEHVLKLQITGSFVNIDWMEFRKKEDKPESIRMQKNFRAFANHDVQVFSLNGKFLGKVHVGGNSLEAALKQAGFAQGKYVVKLGIRK